MKRTAASMDLAAGERMTSEMSYGFASNLRNALPNASFIGFTGTPFEKTDANSRATIRQYRIVQIPTRRESKP